MIFNFKLKVIIILLLILNFCPGTAFTNEFEDAVELINQRNYKGAYNMIVPLAEKGKAAAQLVLGMMYFKGTGV